MPPTPAELITQALDYADRFVAGGITPIASELENHPALALLHDQNSARFYDVEGAIMSLGHGECHSLTLTLATTLGLDKVGLVTDQNGAPVHSAILNASEDMLLDANGAHTLASTARFWTQLVGNPCKVTFVEPDDLLDCSNWDGSMSTEHLEDFGLITVLLDEIGDQPGYEMEGDSLSL